MNIEPFPLALTFWLQHGSGTRGPFKTEAVPAKQHGAPQRRRAGLVVTRFMVKFEGRWRRVYSDKRRSEYPHFINYGGERIAVSGVCP